MRTTETDKESFLPLPDCCLHQIDESGQCFRWRAIDENAYRLFYRNHTVEVVQKGDGLLLRCSEEEVNALWSRYFSIEDNYTEWSKKLDPKDLFLQRAFQYGRGIRILRQDPWETLVTFVLSQRKSIPAIRQCVEALCVCAGTRQFIPDYPDTCSKCGTTGYEWYSFPSIEQTQQLTLEDLRACGLGYRADYLYQLCRQLTEKELMDWEKLEDDELRDKLLSLRGVGIKVATCVLLFGYHRLNAFPEDVWIQRVLKEKYPEGFPFKRYEPYNGYFQQLLFYYRRSAREDFQ